MTVYTSNIQKGGALLDDARRLVEVWDQHEDAESNLERIAGENLLAKPSRARAEDVLRRILRPRLVEPGPQVIAALKILLPSPRSFVEAYYFEATRDDRLLAALAEEPLFKWWEAGRVAIEVNDVVRWLESLGAEGAIPLWTPTIRVKVARGLLAALRDFGLLSGNIRKELVAPSLSIAGFGYVAFRLYEPGASSRALMASPVWRRWLLDQERVAELFQQAAREGLLRYSSAGSTVRVDWLRESLPEVVRAVG
jgi:hypothetical protein